MKAEDNISDKYRKQVDEIFDNQSDINSVNSLSQEELDEIWEEISIEMDIGEVWNNISSDLDTVMPVDSGSGIIVKSIAVVLVILIGMIPAKKAILDAGISQPDILIENKQDEKSTKLIIKGESRESNKGEQVMGDVSSVFMSSSDKSEDSNKPTPAERKRTVLAQRMPLPVSNEVVSKVLAASGMADSNLAVSPDITTVEKSNITPALYPDDLEKVKVFSKTDYNHLKTNNNYSSSGSSFPLIDRGRISGGLITLFKNTWLLNNETFDGLKSESLTTTEIVFFPDAGLSLNYSLNKTWLLQADGFFFSNTGQEYLGYYYGHYSRKEITLRYSKFALSVKYKFTRREPFMNRSSFNLLAGSYLSVLHNASQNTNTDIENIRSQYKKFDFGVSLGSEFELQIFDQLSIAPGLFLSLGIPNIYKGTSNIPGYLRRTHNGSAEFHLAFYLHPF